MWKYLRKHHLTPRAFYLRVGSTPIRVDADEIIRSYPLSVEAYFRANPSLFRFMGEASTKEAVDLEEAFEVYSVGDAGVISDGVISEVAEEAVGVDNGGDKPKRRGRPSKKKEV